MIPQPVISKTQARVVNSTSRGVQGVVIDVGDGRVYRRSGGWTWSALGWGQVALSLSEQLPFALQIDVLHSPRMFGYVGIALISLGWWGAFLFFDHSRKLLLQGLWPKVYLAVTPEKGKDTLTQISVCKGRGGHPGVPFHQLLGILGMSVKGVFMQTTSS